MLLSWKFKTLTGAQRRAAFESAHSKRFRYYPVPAIDKVTGKHCYRIERIPRALQGLRGDK